jgi:hypothetical protein
MAGFCNDSTNTATPHGGTLTKPGKQEANSVFDYLHGQYGTEHAATNDAVNAYRNAANDPGWADAGNLARRTINGDFLNGSPQLDNAIASTRNAGNAEAANAAGRIREQYGQNGLGFGTAQQQAEQGAQAAATAQMNNAEAQTRLQNYQAERVNQQAAPAMLQTADSAPAQFLTSIPNAINQPQAQLAQLIGALYGKNQVVPGLYKDDSVLTQGFNHVGSL